MIKLWESADQIRALKIQLYYEISLIVLFGLMETEFSFHPQAFKYSV